MLLYFLCLVSSLESVACLDIFFRWLLYVSERTCLLDHLLVSDQVVSIEELLLFLHGGSLSASGARPVRSLRTVVAIARLARVRVVRGWDSRRGPVVLSLRELADELLLEAVRRAVLARPRAGHRLIQSRNASHKWLRLQCVTFWLELGQCHSIKLAVGVEKVGHRGLLVWLRWGSHVRHLLAGVLRWAACLPRRLSMRQLLLR